MANEKKQFAFDWRLQQQRLERTRQQALHVKWEEITKAMPTPLEPRALIGMQPINVLLLYLIYEAMRSRFAPAVPTEIMDQDVLLWLARYLQFVHEEFPKSNPDFSDKELKALDILLDGFFSTFEAILQTESE